MPKKNKKNENTKSQNPIGSVDKPRNTKLPAGLDDNTRVVNSEERNRNDG